VYSNSKLIEWQNMFLIRKDVKNTLANILATFKC